MSHGIYAALSGAVAQMSALDQTATNVANASTAGFRAARPVFHELISKDVGRASGGVRYTAMTGTSIDASPGQIRSTGRPLDVVPAPTDFLAVTTARGERYTRAGALTIGSDGTLRSVSGDALLGENGKPVKVDPSASIAVAPDGSVLANGAAVGHLRVVSFAKPEALQLQGAMLFDVGGAGAPTPSKQSLQVGALEDSNTSPVRGMTDLLQTSRMFEAVQRTIEAFHEADRKVLTVPSK
jgi:flagellar basal body rod protein FlgG